MKWLRFPIIVYDFLHEIIFTQTQLSFSDLLCFCAFIFLLMLRTSVRYVRLFFLMFYCVGCDASSYVRLHLKVEVINEVNYLCLLVEWKLLDRGSKPRQFEHIERCLPKKKPFFIVC